MNKNIVLLGPPASGKGTQADLINERLKMPRVQPGKIFRDNIDKGTDLGKLAQKYMSKGVLLPSHITNNIVKKELKKTKFKKGVLIDGYPRDMVQAKALNSMIDLDMVILVNISDKEIVRRVSSRRSCDCGEVYNMVTNPPKHDENCDECGKKLEIREDDKPKAVKKRIQVYHKKTMPIIDYYRKKGILIEINGEQKIEKVYKDIVKVLKK